MIFKFIGFIFTLLWSYTFIKSQNIFKKGSGILITLFISNISWLTFIVACFYGLKTFSLYYFFCGLAFSVFVVQLGFSRLSLYINSKFPDKNKLIKINKICCKNYSQTKVYFMLIPKIISFRQILDYLVRGMQKVMLAIQFLKQ